MSANNLSHVQVEAQAEFVDSIRERMPASEDLSAEAGLPIFGLLGESAIPHSGAIIAMRSAKPLKFLNYAGRRNPIGVGNSIYA